MEEVEQFFSSATVAQVYRTYQLSTVDFTEIEVTHHVLCHWPHIQVTIGRAGAEEVVLKSNAEQQKTIITSNVIAVNIDGSEKPELLIHNTLEKKKILLNTPQGKC